MCHKIPHWHHTQKHWRNPLHHRSYQLPWNMYVSSNNRQLYVWTYSFIIIFSIFIFWFVAMPKIQSKSFVMFGCTHCMAQFVLELQGDNILRHPFSIIPTSIISDKSPYLHLFPLDHMFIIFHIAHHLWYIHCTCSHAFSYSIEDKYSSLCTRTSTEVNLLYLYSFISYWFTCSLLYLHIGESIVIWLPHANIEFTLSLYR